MIEQQREHATTGEVLGALEYVCGDPGGAGPVSAGPLANTIGARRKPADPRLPARFVNRALAELVTEGSVVVARFADVEAVFGRTPYLRLKPDAFVYGLAAHAEAWKAAKLLKDNALVDSTEAATRLLGALHGFGLTDEQVGCHGDVNGRVKLSLTPVAANLVTQWLTFVGKQG